MTEPKTNWRLMRVAESICSCLLTDGFCAPKHKPDCRCWAAARAAMEGLRSQSNPCLDEAWPRQFNTDERRGNLNLLVKAILNKEDELTAMHRAEPSPQETAND
jgi:hypothetical protein